ncbi:MAG: MOSC domain-containing protein [Nitrospira sp.]|nr:MOSC domain-containing protein [Nitrospira sp.]
METTDFIIPQRGDDTAGQFLVVTLHSIQVGMPRTFGSVDATDRMDSPWTTGFFKEPVRGPVGVGLCNLEGDGQADLVNHGGSEKAINVYPLEHYNYWKCTLGLADLPYGAFGENFTTTGCLESDVCIGDIFTVGETVVQISQPRQPCWKLSRRWRIRDLALRVQETGRTGWYFRVLKKGTVEAGAPMVLIQRPCPQWTVHEANQVMHQCAQDVDAARRLLNCHFLSERWRETLRKRIATGMISSGTARLFGPN